MNKQILFIDYENIHDIDLSLIQENNLDVKIFVGTLQNKIPLEVVQTAQKFGAAVEWIQIEGNGSNALDFHIAFYLGKLSQTHENLSFIILSNDKGFDPLIHHANKQRVVCHRINSLLELSPKQEILPVQSECMTTVLDNLSKIAKNKRPRTKKTLHQHIKNLLRNKMSEQGIGRMIESLFIQKKLSEQNNTLKYNL